MNDKDLTWARFRQFCEDNPYCVFDKLEIVNGMPNIGSIGLPITDQTMVFMSYKFKK